MLNFSKLMRESDRISLREKLSELINPEIYVASDIADYNQNKSAIVPPWFKKNFWLSASHYAIVVFYNVGIDGIFVDKPEDDEPLINHELINNYVNVHDDSGSEVICWTEKGDFFPAEKSYFKMLGNFEIEVQDWVYRLVIRHSYDGLVPFVVNVEKNEFSNKRTNKEKNSLVDRINKINSILLGDREQN